MWTKVFQSSWKDFKTKFGGILQALEYNKSLIESQAQLLHSQQYQLDRMKTLESLEISLKLRDMMLQQAARQEDDERRKMYADAQLWLGAPSPLVEHEQASAKREQYQQSGKWIFRKTEVGSWKDDNAPESSLFWLNGIPGAGMLHAFS